MSKQSSPSARLEYHRAWVERNLDAVKAYRLDWDRKKRAKLAAARPSPEPCHCGNREEFQWMSQKWVCIPCRSARTRHNKAKHKAASLRRRGVRQKSARLEKQHGPIVARAFLSLVTRGCHGIQWWQILRRSLPPHLHGITEAAVWRIETLNLALGKPVWNIGWYCQSCEIASDEDRFFDLDHIIPRCRGGKDSISNLQVLCPNCHRTKTISDLHRQRKAGAAACAQGEAKSTLTDGQSPPVKITLTGEPEHSGQNGCLFPDDRVNGNRATSVTA